jgi:hypothetical protein
MQREKLYNLHKTPYFIFAFFVFKVNKLLSDQSSTVRKRYFLVQDEFIFFSPDVFYFKKILQQMQCGKLDIPPLFYSRLRAHTHLSFRPWYVIAQRATLRAPMEISISIEQV